MRRSRPRRTAQCRTRQSIRQRLWTVARRPPRGRITRSARWRSRAAFSTAPTRLRGRAQLHHRRPALHGDPADPAVGERAPAADRSARGQSRQRLRLRHHRQKPARGQGREAADLRHPQPQHPGARRGRAGVRVRFGRKARQRDPRGSGIPPLRASIRGRCPGSTPPATAGCWRRRAVPRDRNRPWPYQLACMRSITPWSAAASLAGSRRAPSKLRSNAGAISKRIPIR